MRRCGLLAAAVAAALALADAAAAALEVRVAVRPARPVAGAPATVELRPFWPFTRADGSCCRLEPAAVRYPFRVEAVAPDGRVFRIRVARSVDRRLWRGSFRFDRAGPWTVRVANYGPSYRHAPAARPRLRVVVRAPAASAAPTAPFGDAGAADCRPASPARRFDGLVEAGGPSVRGRLWALFFGGTWATRDTAVFDHVVGRALKIVWRWSGAAPLELVAAGPGGLEVRPTEGPTRHTSSTWPRAGTEWGTVWVFPKAGCWRVRVARGADLWLVLR